MADLDGIRFFGRSAYSTPFWFEYTVRDGLFKSHTERRYITLWFYEKDGRVLEFFTKEDISDLFPPEKLPYSSPSYSLFNTSSSVFCFDAASFAAKTKEYKEATPSEILQAINGVRARTREQKRIEEEKKRAAEAKEKSDLDWLSRSL